MDTPRIAETSPKKSWFRYIALGFVITLFLFGVKKGNRAYSLGS